MNVLTAIILIAAAATGLLLAAIFGRDMGAGGRLSDVYDDQLAEIDRDLERGVLDADQARLAKAEVERRLLEAMREERGDAFALEAAVSRPGRLAAAIALALVPLGAFGLYSQIGAPAMQDTAFSERLAPAGDIAALTDRLQRDPQDIESWIALAETLRREERHADSVPAYAEALRLSGGSDIRLLGAYGEALIKAGEGEVGPQAREVFAEILMARPGDPRATYYLSLASLQDGEPQLAIDAMRELVSGAPEEAPWLPAARDLLQEAERQGEES